jgi:hypothetical protein
MENCSWIFPPKSALENIFLLALVSCGIIHASEKGVPSSLPRGIKKISLFSMIYLERSREAAMRGDGLRYSGVTYFSCGYFTITFLKSLRSMQRV